MEFFVPKNICNKKHIKTLKKYNLIELVNLLDTNNIKLQLGF